MTRFIFQYENVQPIMTGQCYSCGGPIFDGIYHHCNYPEQIKQDEPTNDPAND